jgi:hypothetical protein
MFIGGKKQAKNSFNLKISWIILPSVRIKV